MLPVFSLDKCRVVEFPVKRACIFILMKKQEMFFKTKNFNILLKIINK